ncbi:MAG: hypothetical protein CTY31_03560 [Hyphomicrobium sp.]|nr:MAG: hypothetical protein CTY31_03560 [Hyphomicrobium sp.]
MDVDARHVVYRAAAFAMTVTARADAWQADEVGDGLFAPTAKIIAQGAEIGGGFFPLFFDFAKGFAEL